MARHQTSENMLALFQEVIGASERAGAIVIVAFIEDALRDCILARLRSLGPEQERLLVDGRDAVLSDLYSKIILGHALGLYSEAVKQDLLVLKNIRNKFAHRVAIRTFKHGEVVALCNKLHFTAREAWSSGRPAQTDPKEQFHDAANSIMTGLNLMRKRPFRMPRVRTVSRTHLNYPLTDNSQRSGASRKKAPVRPSRGDPRRQQDQS